MPNMISWVKDFRRTAQGRAALLGAAQLHRRQPLPHDRHAALLKAAKGQIWFTETGGIVARTNRRKVGFPESAAHAAEATRLLFDRLVPLSRRDHARLPLPLEQRARGPRRGTRR